jgi:carbon-monoxide dehydrogenase large subunit
VIRLTGARVKRVEDPRLLRGQGRYVDDLGLPRMLRVMFVRSPHAHAVVRRVEADAARRVPGVVGVFTAADLRDARPLRPRLEGGGFTPTTWPPLAGDRVQFCGEAVAAVVADSAAAAADGRERVRVDYQPLPAVTSVDEALDQGRVLFQRYAKHGEVELAFARAPVTVSATFTHARVAPSPLEPRGLVADWDGQTLTVWASTQSPRILRDALAAALDLAEPCVRVIAPDVGGGFGLKMHVFPEDVAVAALARRLARPVKWIEERREHLAAASHAREQRVEVAAAAEADGRLRALRARVYSDAGAYHLYPVTAALEPLGSAAILPGPYRTGAYEYECLALATHKPPIGAYRGVGMTFGAFVMERLIDLLAERCGLDPAEVRRRNLIPREAYPWPSPSGLVYDSGDLPKALAEALALGGYDELRRQQARARAEGRLVGIGLACYTEYTGMGAEVFRRRGMEDVPGIEAASVRLEPDGSVRCLVSFPSQGQGHATALAQLVGDRLGVPLERVRVEPVDTASGPLGSGTFGSRGAVAMSGGAAVAADRVRAKLARLAAARLEAGAGDIVVEDGRCWVRGFPDRAVAVADLARAAYSPPAGGLGDGLEPGLEATVYLDPPGPTFSAAVHLAAVEVDRDTGRVEVARYAVVEDCGPVINPLLVEGQVHGAVAQGLGEALLEAIAYGEGGGLLTGTLMDYALPRAADVPEPRVGHLESPAPHVPGGVKGMGEGGTIGAPAAIANAVADAVGALGIRITALPIRPQDLVRVGGGPE